MEIIWYGVIYFLSIVFSFKYKLIKKNLLFTLFMMTFFLITSLIIRNSGFDVDIITYAESMSYSSFSLYYLREPIVWFGQRYLFDLFNDSLIVFVVSDMIFLVLFFIALNLIKVPQYVYFSIFLFFPFFAGFQNVYRQLASEILFLLALSILLKLRKIPKILSLLSILAHNMAAVYIFLILFWSKTKIFKILSLLFLIFLPFFIYVSSSSKSASLSGLNLEWIYVFLFLSSILLVLLINNFLINEKNKNIIILLLFLTYISTISAILLGSSQAERIGMFGLLIFYIFISKYIDNLFKQKIFIRIVYITLTSLPIFIFSSMRQMIE